MIRRSLIILSLCSAVLCAFVGFLSHRAIEESKQLQSSSIELSCSELLKTAPENSTGVQLNDYVLGRHVAGIDIDGDQRWDQGAIPLFPKQRQQFKYGYCAVIVCFKGLPDEAAVDQALIDSVVEADFWPNRQELDPDIYSRLATKYRHMDFSNSRVLYLGYEKSESGVGEDQPQAGYAGWRWCGRFGVDHFCSRYDISDSQESGISATEEEARADSQQSWFASIGRRTGIHRWRAGPRQINARSLTCIAYSSSKLSKLVGTASPASSDAASPGSAESPSPILELSSSTGWPRKSAGMIAGITLPTAGPTFNGSWRNPHITIKYAMGNASMAPNAILINSAGEFFEVELWERLDDRRRLTRGAESSRATFS